MKKLLLIFLAISALAFTDLQAQEFKSAIGIRAGIPLSVTYKTFLNEKAAVEVTGGIQAYTFSTLLQASAAYQMHYDIGDITGFQWYWGGGVFVGIWSYNDGFSNDDGSISFGPQAYGGVSYTFENIPLNLSVDAIPTVVIGGDSFNNGFRAFGSFAARWTFAR